MADGPVIQKSNDAALKNGMSLHLLFEQLNDIRTEVDIPLLMMGYINPVMQYGIDRFCEKCHEFGVDGEEYKHTFEKYNLHMIFLISPQTSDERIHKIDEESRGFIYMVSSSSTTGMRNAISNEQEAYFNRLNNMNLKNPRLIGFGISNHQTFQKACQYANGVIIGSAFIKALAEEGGLENKIEKFIAMIKGE